MINIDVRYEPAVIEFIRRCDAVIQAKIERYIELLENRGHTLRMPYSKPLRDGLFELRIIGTTQVRILYAYEKGGIVLLHGFIKKTDAISRGDLETALRRMHY